MAAKYEVFWAAGNHTELANALNRLDADGWEVVSVAAVSPSKADPNIAASMNWSIVVRWKDTK